MCNMIQRERERRSGLQVKENTLLRVEQTNLTKVREAEEITRDENRSFLERLGIPGYLQAIIDEEQLEGAHVLWWTRAPYCRKLAYRYESFLPRVSLVWGMHMETETFTGNSVTTEHGEHPSSSTVTSHFTVNSGLRFKSVDVSGSAKNKSITLSGCLIKFARKSIDPCSRPDPANEYKTTLNGIPGDMILYEVDLNQPGILQQNLSSFYLDTVTAPSNWVEVKLWESELPGEYFWPFDRTDISGIRNAGPSQ